MKHIKTVITLLLLSPLALLRAADAPRPVKVFILAGQSNMEGQGLIEADPKRNGGKGSLEFLAKDPATSARFGQLMDKNGHWRVRDDVWISYLDRKGPLTVGYGARRNSIGPELGFGWVVGDALEAPVLLIKCAWGGKSLAVDFRPPSAGKPPYSLGEKTDAAIAQDPTILGKYYRETLALTKAALANLKELVPGSDGRYELAGFGWHQGWNDRINNKFNAEYKSNMACFIRDMRKDLRAPNLPFVIAETGMSGPEEKNPRALSLMKAQAAVAELPEFKGNVAFVGTKAFWRPKEQSPSGQGYHWNSNAETYYLIGEAMGRAMLALCGDANHQTASKAGKVTLHSQGLHGYIGFGHEKLPRAGNFTAGMGFYAAVWPLAAQPLANFQIGLPSAWITPDNSDDKDTPLAPEGTLARRWKERGPTWSSVFQTVEGGLGYWAGNHFRYGPPKFSMNATPQCYDYEVGSPGWSFFYSNEALPDNRLGIAQLSNRLLIPPDALPFQGHPNGEFLGYTWMALPFTKPTTGDPPTGDQSWTCFLSAANFKGPIAYYIPETWSKIGKLFNYPFLYGRGLDARPGIMGGGAMEINTVPRFDGTDARGTTYSKLPKLQFPVDAQGRAYLVQDVSYYSKSALYEAFKSWRDGGPACSGRFDEKGAFKPKLNTHTTRYDQAGQKIVGVERAFDTRIFEGNVWGLQWFTNDLCAEGLFPQYYKQVGEQRVAVAATNVPAETRLLTQAFKLAKPGVPYTSPSTGAWAKPGPALGPFTTKLADGSIVTYSWYRFVDQPSFQQYHWSAEKKAKLQAFVEKLHANWPIDRDYMAPPTRGKLVALDPALIVTPPKGLEVGYVPIVTRQSAQ